MEASSFDFVIVGGGTAGLVVANRLSEDASQRVLILEAGCDHTEDPRVNTPGLARSLHGTELDWSFSTTPQPNLGGRSIPLNQGKALGGSSAINLHLFVPPAKNLIDDWGSLGNAGWSWDVFEGYLDKAYSAPSKDESPESSDGWIGKRSWGGPIKTSFPSATSYPVQEAWSQAFDANGYSTENNPSSGISAGSFSAVASIDPKKKERSYATSAYYTPIKERKNLHVLANVEVQKILFDGGELPRATGVRYWYNGEPKTVAAKKEVIVAAGALQSPKILELSGIGDAKLLEEHGIEVVQDLPQVGENLQDHLVCYISYEALDSADTLDAFVRRESEAIKQARVEYEASKTGMLASVGICSFAFLPLVESLSSDGRKTIKELLRQNRPLDGSGPRQTRAQAYHKIAEDTLLDPKKPSGAYLAAPAQIVTPVDPSTDSPAGPVPGKFITFGVMLSQPLSRGSVHIVSDQVSSPPVIDPNYLSNPLDLEVLARHVQYIETLAMSPAFDKLLKRPLRHRDPASDSKELDRAKKHVQTSAVSMWHVAGTCAMLPREKGGVVDSRLLVYGTQNLRVVDSSAIPLVSTANLQATVYAFAERAADLIKETHGLK